MNLRDFQRTLRDVRTAERGIQPDAAWVSRTRGELLSVVEKTMPSHPLTWTDRARAASLIGGRRFVQWFRGPVMAFFSIIGVVVGGSMASVSAAERSIPGDILYGVKLVAEQTRLALTSDKTEKLKLKTEFVQRRVEEIKTIVTTDVSQKPQRIQEATDILKRDLDTVKTQLTDVSHGGTIRETAQAAKMIDQKSSEIIDGLKTVRAGVPDTVKGSVAEAEAAAVNTGMKAVQVLIESKDEPEAQQIVSSNELLQSITNKVQGIEQNINDATQNLLSVSTTPNMLAATTTGPLTTSTLPTVSQSLTSSSISQIESAKNTLDQAKQLLSENKLSEVTDKLLEASKVVVSVEVSTDAIAASSTAAIIPPTDTTTTSPLPGTTTSTITPLPTPTTTSTQTSTTTKP